MKVIIILFKIMVMRVSNERLLPLIIIIAAYWTTEGCREALDSEYWKTVAKYQYWKLSSEISAPNLR